MPRRKTILIFQVRLGDKAVMNEDEDCFRIFFLNGRISLSRGYRPLGNLVGNPGVLI